MAHQKREMLEALERSLGVVTTACKSVGVGRSTHYRWMREDDEYKQSVLDLRNVAIDFAESHLHKLIEQGSAAATIFLLKTIGQERGYVEKQKIEIKERKPLSWFEDN